MSQRCCVIRVLCSKELSWLKCCNTHWIMNMKNSGWSLTTNIYKPPERSSWVLAIIPWWMGTWPPKSLLHLCWTTVRILMMTKRKAGRSTRKTLLTVRGMRWLTRTLGHLCKPPKSKQAQSFWLDGVSGHKFLLFHTDFPKNHAQTCV